MSEFATALSLGTTSIALSMIQDDFLNGQVVFGWEREVMPRAESEDEKDWKQKTLNCFREISLRYAEDREIKILLKDGLFTPVDVQQRYLNLAKTYFKTVREQVWWEKRILEEWEFILNLFEQNSRELEKYVEWSSKLNLLKKHLDLFEKTWSGEKSFPPLKRYFKIYVNGFEKASALREKLMETTNINEARIVLNKFTRA